MRPVRRDRSYYIQLGKDRDKEAIPLQLLNPPPVVEDDDFVLKEKFFCFLVRFLAEASV